MWIVHADFLVRILGCRFQGADFLRGFWSADFFVDFVMACADFGVRIFAAVLGCFPAEKALKKSHQKIPPKNPHHRCSPRNVSSQYTTTLLRARHSRSPQGVWCRCALWRIVFSAQMASVREDERVVSTCA